MVMSELFTPREIPYKQGSISKKLLSHVFLNDNETCARILQITDTHLKFLVQSLMYIYRKNYPSKICT